jgi:hypothetical protein
MGTPTEEELETALAAARRLRGTGDDPQFIAKALLNCHYQMTFLLDVLHAAEGYLRSGLAEHEHTRLQIAIDKAREIDDRGSHREQGTLGL